MKTKRAPTPEQKAAAAERRQRIAAIARKFASLPEAERIRLTSGRLLTTVEGHELSPCNTFLLIHQRDNVSLVGGFDQWKKAGRKVAKGERALAIRIPCQRRTEAPEGVTAETGDDPGNPGVYFALGNVFDISQTVPLDEPEA